MVLKLQKLNVHLTMLLRNSLLAMVNNPVYVEIPDAIDLDNIIVDWTTVHDWIDSQAKILKSMRLLTIAIMIP